MADKKKKEGKGLFSKLFKNRKKAPKFPKWDEPTMEEEIGTEIKKIEPKILKDIDKGKKSVLGNVEPELRLWLSDGRIIKNLPELANAMKNMKKNVFNAHVSRNKNDFSDWIKDIIKDQELAARVKKMKSSKATYEELKRFEKTTKKQEKQEKKKQIQIKKEKAAKQAKKTIEQLMPVIKPAKAKIAETKKLTLKQRENLLLEKEKLLNEEERKLNQKRIELSKRRIALIKERGELEKEKFSRFMKSKTKKSYEEIPFEEETEPEPLLETKNKSEIIESIHKIRQLLKEGNIEAAKKAFEETQTALRTIYLPEEEKRKLQYETLELEADIKLASL